MKTSFTGSWRSAQSNLPGFVAGRELLRFSEEEDHVWQVAQPQGKGRPSITPFVLREEGDDFRLCPIKKESGAIGVGWRIAIKKTSASELIVTPQHGFTTVFRREEEEPHQAPEPTAPSGRGSS